MSNNNLNFKYSNPSKFFINKIWNNNIINNFDNGLNNLDISFNEKLDLKQNLLIEDKNVKFF